MEYQSLLHKKLHTGNFVFTAETTPPDASDKETLIKKIRPLKDIADAINVTDSPGAKTKWCVCPCCHKIPQKIGICFILI